MRGYGSADTQAIDAPLTRPDWGWGDPEPSSWTADSLDYGWGSPRALFPSFLRVETSRVGDDGGYLIEISGDFPRGTASRRVRPSGFNVILESGGTEYTCYSGIAGRGDDCLANLRGDRLRAYTPRLSTGSYNVLVRFANTEQNAGTLSVERRLRTSAEYRLRNAYPSHYRTGSRDILADAMLSGSARDEETGTLEALTRSLGQSLAEFRGAPLTRITSDFSSSATSIDLESTLGFENVGHFWAGGLLFQYATRTATTLGGITRLYGQVKTIPRGEVITYDPRIIPD
jgi:hypothetical protein